MSITSALHGATSGLSVAARLQLKAQHARQNRRARLGVNQLAVCRVADGGRGVDA